MNITYLLGAGASIGAIPVVSKFEDSIEEMYKVLKKLELPNELFSGQFSKEYNIEDIKKDFLNGLKWLYLESRAHASIDTFAKKLWLQNDETSSKKLKKVLSTFFILRQCFFGLDKRYDLFFATILEKDYDNNHSLLLPNNVKIISWNYDYQVELSFANFLTSEKTIDTIDSELNIIPSTSNHNFDHEKFNLIKLNGTAGGFMDKVELKYYRHLLTEYKSLKKPYGLEDSKIVCKALEHYVSYTDERVSTLSFAWEQGNNHEAIVAATNSLGITSILVVIGYSFPTFNRDTDKWLFNNLSVNSKIFIQSMPNDIKGVVERCRSLMPMPIEIQPINYVNEFYIPSEFRERA